MNILEVEGLCKTYPAFRLRDVSFAVEPGAIMGFIGRNGAGKSTTIKAMLNLVHPDSGRVTMFGRDFYADEPACKQQLGVVLGGVDFYPNKKLRSITNVTRTFYDRWDENKYRHYLSLFALDETKKVSQLSSGMRVKYMLALALSHDARLLILDEPTSGLDPVSRDELMELFRGVVQSGERSILFSTHITSDLEKCASHITMIKDGEILRSDTCAGFLAHYRAQLGDASLSLEDILVRVERRNYDGKDFLQGSAPCGAPDDVCVCAFRRDAAHPELSVHGRVFLWPARHLLHLSQRPRE